MHFYAYKDRKKKIHASIFSNVNHFIVMNVNMIFDFSFLREKNGP